MESRLQPSFRTSNRNIDRNGRRCRTLERQRWEKSCALEQCRSVDSGLIVLRRGIVVLQPGIHQQVPLTPAFVIEHSILEEFVERFRRALSTHWPNSILSYSRSEEPRLNSSHVSISYAVFCLKT